MTICSTVPRLFRRFCSVLIIVALQRVTVREGPVKGKIEVEIRDSIGSCDPRIFCFVEEGQFAAVTDLVLGFKGNSWEARRYYFQIDVANRAYHHQSRLDSQQPGYL